MSERLKKARAMKAAACSPGDEESVPSDAPPLRLEWRDPSDLAENPKNWRLHPQEQVASLTDVLRHVGWAGACLFNERTGRLVDGHLRQKTAIEQGMEKVPVLIGSWTEEQEALILATLDPIAAQADADAVKLDELLRVVPNIGSEAIDAMLSKMAEEAGIVPPGDADMPDLPDGDKAPFQQMTFTLHDVQARTVKEAIEAAKERGGFEGSPNENSNGNALAHIAEAFLANG